MFFFFFKQKPAYELRISGWSSDVCSSDLSSADYEKQRASGMIACPVCGDTQVRKAVMSPAVSAKSNQRDTGASIPTSERQVPASAPVVEGRGIALSNSSAAEMEIGRASCRERVCPYG